MKISDELFEAEFNQATGDITFTCTYDGNTTVLTRADVIEIANKPLAYDPDQVVLAKRITELFIQPNQPSNSAGTLPADTATHWAFSELIYKYNKEEKKNINYLKGKYD